MSTMENNLDNMFESLSDEMKQMNSRLDNLNADFFTKIVTDALERKEAEYIEFFD